MKYLPHFESSAKVASSPTATQTNPRGDLECYRAEANLNLSAVVEFVVTAQDVNRARQRAQAILNDCDPQIVVRLPTGETLEVALHPENVETELLEIVKEQPASEHTSTVEQKGSQPYWVVTWDKACDQARETLVEADSMEQADAEGIKEHNEDNGCGPRDDGGFIPCVAYTRSDLLRMLKEMDNMSNGGHDSDEVNDEA